MTHAGRSGEEAIRNFIQRLDLHPRPFDLVIADFTVRGSMDGPACARRLRELGCDAPALLSSGYSRDPVFLRCREYGFYGALPKPYSLRELRATLDAVLGAASVPVIPASPLPCIAEST